MKKRNNNEHKASREGEHKSIQLALFDLEASGLVVSSPGIAADHTQPQSSQSVDIEPKSATDNKEYDMKSHFTPKEIVNLMVKLLEPRPEAAIYDPCCGSGASLVAILHYLEENYPGRETELFGQEPRSDLSAQARTALSHSSNASINICEGDALQNPNWLENNKLKCFDYIISNPPWNQEVSGKYFALASHEERFKYGIPKRYADWGWIQHILASLSDQGRAVILTSMGAITRGIYSEGGSEQKIRIQFILRDCIEAAIRLPDSLFDEVSFPCALLILNRHKSVERQNQILEIDASQLFVTTSGEQPKKRLTQEGINTILDIYKYWETRDQLSKVVTTQEAKAKRYNLNPSVYNRSLPRFTPLEEIHHKIASVRAEHLHIYTEIVAKLDNQHIADLALAREFSTAISKIVSSRSSQDKSPGIILFRQYLPYLQSIVQQEITLEEAYKQSLMHGFFTDPVWTSECLGTITTVSSGGNPSSKDKRLYGDKFCWVQIQDLNNSRVKRTAKMLSEEGVFTTVGAKLAPAPPNVIQ